MNRSRKLLIVLVLIGINQLAISMDDDNADTSSATQMRMNSDGMESADSVEEEYLSPEFISAVTRDANLKEFNHNGYVLSVAFDRAKKYFATGSADRKARIFDVSTMEPLGEFIHDGYLQQGEAWVQAVAFDPAGERLVTGNDDANTRMFDIAKKELLFRHQHAWPVHSISFDSAGKRFAVGGYNHEAHLFDSATMQSLGEIPHNDWVQSVAFNPAEDQLATGCNDGDVRIFDGTTLQFISGLGKKGDWVRSIAIDPTGKKIAMGYYSGNVYIADIKTNKILGTVKHSLIAQSVAFDPTGKLFATGGNDGKARIYNSETLECLYVIDHGDKVRSVAFDSEGRLFATGCHDYKARIWDLEALRATKNILSCPDKEQRELLQACEIPMKKNKHTHITAAHLETFQKLPQGMQKALKRFIVGPGQHCCKIEEE